MSRLPEDLHTYLAWQFEAVLPGSFRRDKRDYAHIEFPILAPLPSDKAATRPLEGASKSGPYVYFVVDRHGDVHYVGKSKEKTVIKRWVRPGLGGPTTHYWTHTNKSAGCVRRIANGIHEGHGPFQLRFLSTVDIPESYCKQFSDLYPGIEALDRVEKGFMSMLGPTWNDSKSYK